MSKPTTDQSKYSHVFPGAFAPDSHPAGYTETRAPGETAFDPTIHLQLEPPKWIKPLISEHSLQHGDHPVAFPLPVNSSPGGLVKSLNSKNSATIPYAGLAYTSSFRILSDEGVRVMRECIQHNEQYSMCTERIPKMMRGIGYRSKFIRDFTFCPQVLQFLAQCSGVPIHPHDMLMNIAQINFGELNTGKPVDKWHLDSVPYVMVVLLSDATDMIGGELQVARIQDPEKALHQVTTGAIDTANIEKVNYPGPGHAIFMQGSRIAHGVTPVLRAPEPRLTLVNSYQTRNPFAKWMTRYRTFKMYDPTDAVDAEISRHCAWRAQGQLDYILKKGLFEKGNENILAILDSAQQELQRAKDFITGAKVDDLPWKFDEKSEMAAAESRRIRNKAKL